jgi:hypothetical protein
VIRRLELTMTQQLLWDRLETEQVHTLRLILTELGGKLSEPWQFDRANRVFWMNEPESDGPNSNQPDA